MTPLRVLVWIVEGTWRGCVDAATEFLPAEAEITLIHVIPAEVPEAAEAAAFGLWGRRQVNRDAGERMQAAAEEAALDLLTAAEAQLGRKTSRVSRRGRVEQEMVAAAEGIDLLVVARDGDRSRLGPRSLGPATRFVVDHAPCAVLLVWPEETPEVSSIPPLPARPLSPPRP